MAIPVDTEMIGTIGATQQPLPHFCELQPEPGFAERIQWNRHVSFGSMFDTSPGQTRDNGNGGRPGRNSGTSDAKRAQG